MESFKKLNVAPDILAVIPSPPLLTRESKDEYFHLLAGIMEANTHITARLRTKIGARTYQAEALANPNFLAFSASCLRRASASAIISRMGCASASEKMIKIGIGALNTSAVRKPSE